MTHLRESGGKGRQTALELLEWQRAGFAALSKSPFYDALFGLLIEQLRAGDRRVEALLERTPMSLDAVPTLRLVAGVQRCWFDGLLPELDAVWPVDDRPGDPDGAFTVLQAVFADPPDLLLDWLTRDPQTNEVGRAAALAVGLNAVAATTRLPLRVFEIGSSAGLNLRLDRFGYQNCLGQRWGDTESPVQFTADDYAGTPPFGADAQIVERRGCDIHPIDAATRAGQLQLLSYVWPDQPARIARLRAALEVAARVPVVIDRASAAAWVDEYVHTELGTTTVLVHSIMWQYLPEEQRREIRSLLDARGAAARADAPLAWVTLEPAPEIVHADVTVTVWPDGGPRVVATSGYHGPPVTYLVT